jgi:hypothetical protein
MLNAVIVICLRSRHLAHVMGRSRFGAAKFPRCTFLAHMADAGVVQCQGMNSKLSKSGRRYARAVCCGLGIGLAVALLMKRPASTPTGQADLIVVNKQAHSLTLLRDGMVLRTYRVALGRGGPGQKTKAGDNRVPEGVYRIVGRNQRSSFYRALRIGYPTPAQLSEARRIGIDPGGDIMVHGIRNGLGWLGPLQQKVDWTKGCIAVTDSEMDEIWRSVADGTPIEIRP